MSPAFEFPVPILSVAADAVRELEGGEALSGLWTLFTKCKASLKDGHRLENISWRLWYREMMATAPSPKRTSDQSFDRDNQTCWDAHRSPAELVSENPAQTNTLTQTHLTASSPPTVALSAARIPGKGITSSTRQPLRPHSQPNAPKTLMVGARTGIPRRNSFVGKIIVDMLPNPLPPSEHPRASSDGSSYFTATLQLPQAVTAIPYLPTPAVEQEPEMIATSISISTATPASISLSTSALALPSSTDAANAPLPPVHILVEGASTPPPPPPRLVVVHPTPGPTPHPTPPATPVLGGNHVFKPDAVPHQQPQLLPPSIGKDTAHAGREAESASSGSAYSDRAAHSSVSVFTTSTPTTEPKPASSSLASTATRISNTTAATTVVNSTPGGASKVSSPSPVPPPVRRSRTHLSPDAGPSRAPRAQGHIRQTSSTGSRGKGKTSRSRSRGGEVLGGLTMTSAAAAGKKGPALGAGAGGGTGRGGRTLGAHGLKRTGSGRAGLVGRAGKEKRPTFNIGSHSDEGSGSASVQGSKSAGSGSSVSGPVAQAKDDQSGKGAPTQAPQLPPPPQQQQQQEKKPPVTTTATRPAPPPAAPAPALPNPAALFPTQPRRTIVLTTSDSEYETETDIETESDQGAGARRGQGDKGPQGGPDDGDETGEWSSEDMSTDEVEVVVRRGGQQQAHPPPVLAPAAHQAAAAAITNTANNTTRRATQQPQPHLSRVQQSRRDHAAQAQYIVEQAALEAQRMREMFAKKPVPSSEQLAGAKRTRSVGLLTQLMNPDPLIFPPNHPYRRGYSSGEIKPKLGGIAAQAQAHAQVGGSGLERREPQKQQPEPVQPEPVQPEQVQPVVSPKKQLPEQQVKAQRRVSAGPAPGLKLSKSSAALPVASQVQVGSISREEAAPPTVHAGSGASGGYRPKGRPADQELEDDTDTEEDSSHDGILVSKSVAQEKLKALAARRGIVPNGRRDEEEEEPVPEWIREPESAGTVNGNGNGSGSRKDARRVQNPPRPQPAPQVSRLLQSSRNQPLHQQQHQQYRQQQQQHHERQHTPAPIPVGHPYNLPPPAPPSTPRTTRRLMLQTEMSESLRRNLLWERQVSKVNLVGFRRTASSGGVGGAGTSSGAPGGGAGRGGTVLGGQLRPLTELPSMVQLTAKQSGNGAGNGGANGAGRQEERERRGSGENEQEREERKKRALARNRSWANDYHYTGW
ncbi:hypothetical protein H0H81_005957 [Sphagnurus paluster]|uniref:Nitrogen regulatory protein areA GATA-like domain-containing protein n=1 Tax=Sphagnurus paluster TaxID=117069 RepID=A0A9P7GLD1_9AGAR|nr:hypothetical protein H0H81_005957 [Sphagnurus paluster]